MRCCWNLGMRNLSVQWVIWFLVNGFNNWIFFQAMVLDPAQMPPLLLVPTPLMHEDLNLDLFKAPLPLQASKYNCTDSL